MSKDFKKNTREFGAIMVNRLDQLKQRVFQLKVAIDQDFPDWPARRSEFPDDFLRHEARREFFVTTVILLENAQLSYMLLRDHLTDDAWWDKRLSDVSEDKRKSVLYEYAVMVKWFLLHGVLMAVEETLRAIQRAAPNVFFVTGRFRSVVKVTAAILNETGLQAYEELFRLTRLTRNTIHTNGVFLPEDQKDQEVQYGGETFSFEYGKVIEWLNDQRAVWLVEQLAEAVHEIVRSAQVSGLAYCPRTEVEGG
ncbi:MAG: hypothetical protein ACE5JO_02270 [Candidatus Binatia bacterium]